MRSTTVSPSATRPAITRLAEARRSVAITVGALQALDAAHHRGVALDRDVGAQALQLERVHEAVLEDGLGDDARCRWRCVASAMNCACMSVAKPGYGAVRTLTALGRPGFDLDGRIVLRRDARAGLAQLLQGRIEGTRARRRCSRTLPPVAATAAR